MRTRAIHFAIMCALMVGASSCGSDEDSASTSNTLADPSTTTTAVAATVASTNPSATVVVVVPTVAPETSTTAKTVTTIAATTTTAAATTTTVVETTTTTIPPGASLSLRSDGIGDAPFGAEPDEVVGYVSALVGDPAEDSGWVDAISRTCPGTEVRHVRWGDLTLVFGDDSAVATGRRHFFAWSFGPAADIEASPRGVATSEGISIASSVADIGRAYPATRLFEGDELSTASASIEADLLAFLTTTRDDGVITAMLGGQGCGE